MWADHLTGFADILLNVIQDDECRVNLGEASDGSGVQAAAPIWGPDGYIASPNEPSATGTCQSLFIREADQKFVIATRDHRFQKFAGTLKPGDRAIVTDSSARFILKKEAGTVTLYTTDTKDDDGHAIYLQISPDKGLEFSSPWARIQAGPLGIHLLHSSGASLRLGAIGGLPGPLSSLGSYAKLEGGIASVKGGAVSMGTDGGVANELAVQALIEFIAALVVQIGTITTVTPGATAMAEPAFAALLAALPTVLAPIGKTV